MLAWRERCDVEHVLRVEPKHVLRADDAREGFVDVVVVLFCKRSDVGRLSLAGEARLVVAQPIMYYRGENMETVKFGKYQEIPFIE